MENAPPRPIPSTTTTMTSTPQENHPQFSTFEPVSCSPSTNSSPSATQYYCYPAQYLAPNLGLPFQFTCNYYPYQQAGHPMYPSPVWGQPNVVAPTDQDMLGRQGWIVDAHVSKAARNERRRARQRSLSLSRNNANTAASSGGSSSSRRHASLLKDDDNSRGFTSSSSFGAGAVLQNNYKHLYTFCTPDNKKLRLLFKKELKNSDVGSLGRIVLPKREAEENLPTLFDKEGIQLTFRDVYSDQEWGLKYKYWCNNKSRMYLFDNTGDFVKQKELEVGDCICLYEDECKNLYLSFEKVARPVHVVEPSFSYNNNNNNNSSNSNSTIAANTTDNNTKNPNIDRRTHSNNQNATANRSIPSPYTYVASNEEDASSLEKLIEQLEKEEQEANSLVTLSMDWASSTSYRQHEEANTSSSNVTGHIETSTQPSTYVGTEPSSSSSSQVLSRLTRMVGDDPFEFDDCYKGLGTLPEVDCYKHCDFSLFDYNGSKTDEDMP